MAILRVLLVCCPPVPGISGVVGSEWLGVMAGVSSQFKTVGERERILGVKRFWLIDTETGAPWLGYVSSLELCVGPWVIVSIDGCDSGNPYPIGYCAPQPDERFSFSSWCSNSSSSSSSSFSSSASSSPSHPHFPHSSYSYSHIYRLVSQYCHPLAAARCPQGQALILRVVTKPLLKRHPHRYFQSPLI